ncbi:MAG: hypothetical protein IPP79_04910 [Chitinophagaceae bacterium]|nr:hypothetical protein [Chitinophagaceae bacterium]
MPWSEKNDDINLTTTQFLGITVQGNPTVQMDLPGLGGSKAVVGSLILAGNKSRRSIVGILDKTAEVLQSYKKSIRFGVAGHPDNLVKGFHLHFDEIIPGLELGLVPMAGGEIGLLQVGKKVGTANEIKNATTLFSQAMANSKFRSELLVRLKLAQEHLQNAYSGTKKFAAGT